MSPKVKKSFQPKKTPTVPPAFPADIAENAEEIATAIAKISRGMEVLSASRMKPKAVLLLISHASKVPQRTVEDVLNALASLEKTYLK